MQWNRAVDAYCERLGPEFWAEPVNAATNAAFLLAAWVMWRRLGAAPLPLPLARAMVALLAAIGLGSFLFHSFATAWTGLADTVPIGLFVLLYVHVANLHFWTMKPWLAGAATLVFVPYSIASGYLFTRLPFFEISAVYWPVPLLIAIYAVALRNRTYATSRGLALGAAILTVSLVFRSLDMPLCTAVPLGTHFVWHLLNATMLGWMIEVYRRHMLAGAGAGR
ncbi:MAG: ceramidase [Rhodobacteraceae bacterium]|nr:ceramidase [Paracoccaceae bacterium]